MPICVGMCMLNLCACVHHYFFDARAMATVNEIISRDVYSMLAQLWGLGTANENRRVPCNHPCSLMRDNLPRLRESKHWVSPKFDGVRTFVLFSYVDDADYVVMVNRAGTMHAINAVNLPESYSGTLLDGELMCAPDGQQTLWIFDTLSMNGYLMTQLPHSERMAAITTFLKTLQVHEPNLSIRLKPWYVWGEVDLRQIVTDDGLIIIPESGALLRPGCQRDHFKWKPQHQHTIDMVWSDGRLWLERQGVRELATFVCAVEFNDVVVADNTVVEVGLQPVNGQWLARVVRVRLDKLTPNDCSVADKTLKNIVENIQLDELYA